MCANVMIKERKSKKTETLYVDFADVRLQQTPFITDNHHCATESTAHCNFKGNF